MDKTQFIAGILDKYPERITKIDATLPIADIYAIIEAQVQALI